MMKAAVSVSLPPLASPEVQRDPLPFYQRLREDHPVYKDPDGYWILTRHADVIAALRNYADFSSSMGVGPGKVSGTTILDTDPPLHTRMRAIMSRSFQPGSVEALAPQVESIAHRLIDESAAHRGSFDLMEDFAIPLSLHVIARVIGLDPERHRDYRRWSQATIGVLGHPESLSARARHLDTSREFTNYITQLSLQRARTPEPDLISLLLAARREKTDDPPMPKLSAIEYSMTLEVLLTAGSETTSALIGNSAFLLTANPSIVRDTMRDPSLFPSLIEECLRMEGPFQGDFRTTTRSITLHGVDIPEGSKVALVFGAANRDPSVFRDPDRFDPLRSPNPHVSFGNGIHHCLGAPLARMEARIAAEVLARRFRVLEPDPARPPIRSMTNPLFRSFASIPMRFLLC